MCHNLERRSYFQGKGHSAHIPKIRVRAITPLPCYIWIIYHKFVFHTQGYVMTLTRGHISKVKEVCPVHDVFFDIVDIAMLTISYRYRVYVASLSCLVYTIYIMMLTILCRYRINISTLSYFVLLFTSSTCDVDNIVSISCQHRYPVIVGPHILFTSFTSSTCDVDDIVYYRIHIGTLSSLSCHTSGVACQQGTLTPPDTWSCPFRDLHLFYLLRPATPYTD